MRFVDFDVNKYEKRLNLYMVRMAKAMSLLDQWNQRREGKVRQTCKVLYVSRRMWWGSLKMLDLVVVVGNVEQ